MEVWSARAARLCRCLDVHKVAFLQHSVATCGAEHSERAEAAEVETSRRPCRPPAPRRGLFFFGKGKLAVPRRQAPLLRRLSGRAAWLRSTLHGLKACETAERRPNHGAGSRSMQCTGVPSTGRHFGARFWLQWTALLAPPLQIPLHSSGSITLS